MIRSLGRVVWPTWADVVNPVSVFCTVHQSLHALYAKSGPRTAQRPVIGILDHLLSGRNKPPCTLGFWYLSSLGVTRSKNLLDCPIRNTRTDLAIAGRS
jgi:hypothetical protein